MLDVRPTSYVAPLAEQPIGPITPLVQVVSFGDEPAVLTGLFRIYRKSTDQLLYTSEILPTIVAGNANAQLSALTPWDPPAPADDDYIVLFQLTAKNDLVPDGLTTSLGAFLFDVKPVPMGPVPAGHHTTHERGGMDPIHIEDLGTAEPDDSLVLAPDGAGGVVFRAEAGGGGGTPTSEVPQVLTDQAAIDWDLSLGGAATITLGGDRTMNAPTNMVNGTHASLRIIQDGTGTRLLTWNAAFRFPAGVYPCLSAAPNNIDHMEFRCDGSHLDLITMTNALA